jgi:hypothetical protein
MREVWSRLRRWLGSRLGWWALVTTGLTVVSREEVTMNLTRSRSGPAGDLAEATGGLHPARGIARTAGLLLILATAAVMAADAVEPEFAVMARHPDQLATSLLLRIVAAGASVGIAISLYPLLRKVDQALATGSVVFRTIEAVMYLVGVVAVLSLLPLSEQSASATGERTVTIRVMVHSLTTVRHSAGLVAVFAFAVGALMYYSLFYRAKLVPRWLSVWGLLAGVMIFIACLLSLFRSTPVSDYVLLAAPLFLQEIVLGVWLLTRGFNMAQLTTSESAHVGTSNQATPGGD